MDEHKIVAAILTAGTLAGVSAERGAVPTTDMADKMARYDVIMYQAHLKALREEEGIATA